MTADKDHELNAAFAQMRAQNVPASDALLDRVMMDADAVLALQKAPKAASDPTGWAKGFMQMIGGWPSLGGLVAAGLAGFWLGIAPPQMLRDQTAQIFGETLFVPMTEDDLFAQWGGE